jgi:hypothetical protein
MTRRYNRWGMAAWFARIAGEVVRVILELTKLPW